MLIAYYNPTPAPPGVFKDTPHPRIKANVLSKCLYQWISPILKVGFSRPLEVDDLWQLTDDLKCGPVAAKLDKRFKSRMPPSRRIAGPNSTATGHDILPYSDNPAECDSDEQPLISPHAANRVDGEPSPADVKLYGKRKAKRIADGDLAYEDGKAYDMSLWKAIFLTVQWDWYFAMIFLFTGYMLRIIAPYVTKLVITQITLAQRIRAAQQAGLPTDGMEHPKSLAHGIGLSVLLAFSLWAGGCSTLFSRQKAATMGCRTRAAVIDLISRKSLRLSGKARVNMSNGRINTMISADSAYIESVLPRSTEFIVGPLVIIACGGFLIQLLGYSALVGLGFLFIVSSTQSVVFKKVLNLRKTQSALVDSRVNLLTEVINNIRAVKLYAYDDHFAQQVSHIRGREHVELRRNGFLRAFVRAVFVFTPTLATIITFVTYALTGHDLDPGTIFAALQLFGLIKFPIGRLPLMYGNLMDALSGVRRIRDMLMAEELVEHINIDPKATFSVCAQGEFQYDSFGIASETITGRKDQPQAVKKQVTEENGSEVEQRSSAPFTLRNIDLSIPHGALVCIVGRVGSGKSALLSALINEMKQIRGTVTFGGKVSYVPQQAWVQSGTIRENITFGSSEKNVDLDRVDATIDACGLRPDVDMWHHGDLTRVGERGITLSGGQKQRLCIARAAYDEGDIVLLDDPLSAVDAHVGVHLLDNCILNGPFANRTRILVTHHLDVLPKADIILVMERDADNNGRIIQHGTYSKLREEEGVFRTLIEDFGSVTHPVDRQANVDADAGESQDEKPGDEMSSDDGPKDKAGKLIMDEERNFGEVTWSVYYEYCKAVGSWTLLVQCLLEYGPRTLSKGLRKDNIYRYTEALGIGAFTAFISWASFASVFVIGLRSSSHLFRQAWHHVIRSPVTWHDQTPTGRIISRLSKDIQMVDDELPELLYETVSISLNFLGNMTVILTAFPFLALVFLPLFIYFHVVGLFYRTTSRELKRLDSLLRSHVYSSFAEQLAGLPVIRAFNQQSVFQERLRNMVNDQNRAAFLSLALQGWMFTRLDAVSYLVVMMVAISSTMLRSSSYASYFGVILAYTINASMFFTGFIPNFAYLEREMNNVERLQYYGELEMEAAPNLPSDPPVESWPSRGEVIFKDVELKYRPEYPLILKGISFDIKPGEKVGIIGRTGAGKSSIGQALFRAVEICGGSITIDGVDVQTLGLETLRTRLSVIPQDAFLFAGSVRENIDPLGTKSDAELNEALNLVHENGTYSHSLREKFKLDATVLAEGSNFSAGEKQLLVLIRALVRNCKVLLLDEATSSVDPETDALIQRIIQTEFSDVTLMSIAHRLQTVAYYDRILVLDAGRVVEFDTPLALFDNPGSVFRSLCQKKDIHREQLLRIQADAALRTRKASGSLSPQLIDL